MEESTIQEEVTPPVAPTTTNFDPQYIEDGFGKQAEDQQRSFDGAAQSGGNDEERVAVGKALGLNKFADLKNYQDQVTRIIDWAKEDGAKSVTDIIAKINALQNEVGKSANIYNLSVYAGLRLDSLRIAKQLKEFTKK